MKWLKELEEKLGKMTPEEIKAFGEELPKPGKKDVIIGYLPEDLRPLAALIAKMREQSVDMLKEFMRTREDHDPDENGGCEKCNAFRKQYKAIEQETDLLSDMLWHMVMSEMTIDTDSECLMLSKGYKVIGADSPESRIMAIGIPIGLGEMLSDIIGSSLSFGRQERPFGKERQ